MDVGRCRSGRGGYQRLSHAEPLAGASRPEVAVDETRTRVKIPGILLDHGAPGVYGLLELTMMVVLVNLGSKLGDGRRHGRRGAEHYPKPTRN